MSPGRALSVSDARRTTHDSHFSRRMPFYTYAGAVLTIGSWIVSWARISPWYFYSFFPLWLGFIFFLDGLTVARHGTSILSRSRKRFAMPFLYSTPCWWVYEILNLPVQNWHYHGYEQYAWLFAFAHTTVDFSTVLPAVMEMAELLSTFPALRPQLSSSSAGVHAPRHWALGLVGLGGVALLLAVSFPRFAFPLVWVCMVFLLDPPTISLVGNLRSATFLHVTGAFLSRCPWLAYAADSSGSSGIGVRFSIGRTLFRFLIAFHTCLPCRSHGIWATFRSL